MKEPDLSVWHVRVIRYMNVLSVSGGAGAQGLQSMMFEPNKSGPILYARTRQQPRGFPRLAALKVHQMTPDLKCLHVMQKDGGEDMVKAPRISSSLLALKTETEGDDGFGICSIL